MVAFIPDPVYNQAVLLSGNHSTAHGHVMFEQQQRVDFLVHDSVLQPGIGGGSDFEENL